MPVFFHPIPEDERAAAHSQPNVGSHITPDDAKDLALKIALQGVGSVAPNPLVGAVIVDAQHQFLGAGAHLLLGAGHAEVNAVDAARKNGHTGDFSGCTLYVTLEPCAHESRTPSCAKAMAREKFAKVIYGGKDPNPKVSGQGAAIIKAAGITCEIDQEWSRACRRVCEVFLWETTHKSPFVGLKAAISLDGAIAKRGDQRQFITGARARSFGHYLRLKYDAIMIGAWTLLHDDPSLTPRDSKVPGRTPWRIVVDPSSRALQHGTRNNAQLLKEGVEKVIWITSFPTKEVEDLKSKRPGITFVQLGRGTSGVIEPEAILKTLYELGITSVLLEGGSGLYRPFMSRKLVNRFHLFQAATFMTGTNKIALFEGEDSPFRTEPEEIEITPLGKDWLTEFSTRPLTP